jgi:sugar/nucleoside kinase (ribokinase family)
VRVGAGRPAASSARPAIDLLVVGDCNPDVLIRGDDLMPAFGQQEKLVDAISLVVGGSAAITAVAAARLGLRVALAAAIGDDSAGQFMLGQLATAGVDTSAVTVRASLPTGMTVVLSRIDDRAILTAAGAIATLTAADVPAALVAKARHVHLSSYFLMARSLGPGLPDLFEAARSAGTTTSIDTNWDPAQTWGDDNLAAVMAQTDLLVPNEEEALRITGAATLDEAIAALAETGATVAVKLGARGALCFDGPRRYLATPPPVQPVDSTGAGDSFNAGLLTGLLQGLELPDALALGCAVGALSTQAAGGTGGCPDLATASEVASRVTVSAVEPSGR